MDRGSRVSLPTGLRACAYVAFERRNPLLKLSTGMDHDQCCAGSPTQSQICLIEQHRFLKNGVWQQALLSRPGANLWVFLLRPPHCYARRKVDTNVPPPATRESSIYTDLSAWLPIPVLIISFVVHVQSVVLIITLAHPSFSRHYQLVEFCPSLHIEFLPLSASAFCESLEMAIDWKKFETVFRLLAAVHATLGEDAVSLSSSIFNACPLCQWSLCETSKIDR